MKIFNSEMPKSLNRKLQSQAGQNFVSRRPLVPNGKPQLTFKSIFIYDYNPEYVNGAH
jgi:hypothetical protein